jgi:transposase
MENIAIPMPEKRITFKKAPSGTEYAYYTTRAYRNKHGKPTSEQVAVGKKDSITGGLFPNRRYYEIFHEKQTMKNTGAPQKVRSCGNAAAMTEIARQIELYAVLKKCFPSKWDQILASAFYIICESNVMMYIDDWFDNTKVGITERMDDQDCSKLFASITEKERTSFFAEWVKCLRESEYIAYDVSSVSSYSANIEIAEWGYNRDQDNLPQMNLGLYYGITSQVPIYYNLYSGSIPDKTYLDFMMTGAQDLGIRNVCFIMDRGFVTEDNFRCILEKQFSFITALPGQRVDALRLIDENKTEIRKSVNRIGEYEVYGIKRPIDLGGSSLYAHIYYDSDKQAFDEKELYSHIGKLHSELEKISRSKRAAKKYRDYFLIEEKASGLMDFELDTSKVDKRLERAGFFILLSSKPDLGSDEVLKIYRGRDVIEKNFEQFKNRLDFKRMRTHWSKTTEGKMFVGFIALILRSCMLRRLKSDSQTKHLTFEKVLIELRKIKSVTMSDASEVLIPLTKLQKTILSALDVPTELLAG